MKYDVLWNGVIKGVAEGFRCKNVHKFIEVSTW